MYRSFEEMPVWQKSLELSIHVFKLTLDLPKSEDYGLTSQIRRASNSVSANIAEAFGRRHLKDKSIYYVVSRGSAYETKSHLLYGMEAKYFDRTICNSILDGYDDLIFELNKIIKSLQNS